MRYDFIIIGSGLAGLNCALNAAKKGKVLLVTKGKLQESNTWLAQGGIASVMAAHDSFKKHVNDTLKAGAFHNNRKAVEFIVRKGPSAIKKLLRRGIPFARDKQGSVALNLEGGHCEKRIVHCGDHTGREIEKQLIKLVHSQKNITVKEKTFSKDLLVRNAVCYGVRIIEKKRFQDYYGGKIILATGGLGQVYVKTTNPEVATGDGIAMAFRAGCQISDLEFIQFHPTALYQKASPNFLLSETLRGHGAKIVNTARERFMLKIHKLAELAPRDIVSRAIYMEEKKGPVYLDMTGIPGNEFKKEFSDIWRKLRSLDLDPGKKPVRVTPVAHYSCGGITTDLRGKTGIKNLYAFGEVAHTGLHGANRLASNSLLEALVMSEQILREPPAKEKKHPDFRALKYKKQLSSRSFRKKIQKLMWDNVGIIRTKKNLAQTVNKLKALRQKLPPSTDIESSITENLLIAALQITRAALRRKKSLGCHYIK